MTPEEFERKIRDQITLLEAARARGEDVEPYEAEIRRLKAETGYRRNVGGGKVVLHPGEAIPPGAGGTLSAPQ